MIAFDTCVIVNFLQGARDEQTNMLMHMYQTGGKPVLPPVVITELTSDTKQAKKLAYYVNGFVQLEILPDYWERTGSLKTKLRAKKLKANTADALIAQFCIDHDIPLCTSDTDFKHYAKHGGLKLA